MRNDAATAVLWIWRTICPCFISIPGEALPTQNSIETKSLLSFSFQVTAHHMREVTVARVGPFTATVRRREQNQHGHDSAHPFPWNGDTHIQVESSHINQDSHPLTCLNSHVILGCSKLAVKNELSCTPENTRWLEATEGLESCGNVEE